MDTVILIGRKTDPHIQGIISELDKLNQKYVVLDEFSVGDSFTLQFPEQKLAQIKTNQFQINNNEIKSIWNSSSLKVSINPDIVEESKKFVQNEWSEGIMSLWNSIETNWVNHPEAIEFNGNRLKQLKLAHEIGWEIPQTMITCEPGQIYEFYKKCQKNIIAKTLNSSIGLPEGKMIFSSKINEKDLERSLELQNSPCMFQEYVDKKTEFRSTIIGETIHSVEIHSQKSEKTKHDWRHYDDFKKTPYISQELPDEINSKLLQMMKKMGLKFGAADIIRTPDDEYYFLEINPNGRWWWIQELTGINIAKDIASYLIN